MAFVRLPKVTASQLQATFLCFVALLKWVKTTFWIFPIDKPLSDLLRVYLSFGDSFKPGQGQDHFDTENRAAEKDSSRE